MSRLILSYGARTPAKQGVVSAYYEEDVIELEALVRKAASGRTIDEELTRLVEQGVDLNREQGLELTSLRKRLRTAERHIETLELREKPRPRRFLWWKK